MSISALSRSANEGLCKGTWGGKQGSTAMSPVKRRREDGPFAPGCGPHVPRARRLRPAFFQQRKAVALHRTLQPQVVLQTRQHLVRLKGRESGQRLGSARRVEEEHHTIAHRLPSLPPSPFPPPPPYVVVLTE